MTENKISFELLRKRQALSLDEKVSFAIDRITNFYEINDGNVYISFSGGKDSTVLLDIVRTIYPNVPAIFVDTGLEFPEIRDFVRTIDNVIWLRPEKSFLQVIKEEGYPVVSKEVALKVRQGKHCPVGSKSYNLRNFGIRSDGVYTKIGEIPKKWKKLLDAPFEVSEKCCNILKKKPFHKYDKESGRYGYNGMMASDSNNRARQYLKHGCNIYQGSIQSKPLSIWMEDDIWDYLHKYNVKYSKIYDMGYSRTGCIFCMFGVHMEKGLNRFQTMQKTHPQLYKYCMETLDIKTVLEYIDIPYECPSCDHCKVGKCDDCDDCKEKEYTQEE